MMKKLEIDKLDENYLKCVSDLINNEVVLSMKQYIQHGSTTTFEHCLMVSYMTYKAAKKLKLDYVSASRAALLHDLFLYDWHKTEKKKLFEKHGFTHPQKALENATKYFHLNDVEKDIIAKHMWPLTLTYIPKYKESALVSAIDKICSTKETFSPYKRKVTSSFKFSKKNI